jgi:tetratricopeptide (TPR) repeat protein
MVSDKHEHMTVLAKISFAGSTGYPRTTSLEEQWLLSCFALISFVRSVLRDTFRVYTLMPSLALLTSFCAFAQNGDFERARELLASGHPTEAAAIFRRLSRSQPNSADMLVNLGIAEYRAGNFGKSAAAAQAALNIDPALLPARLFLGASYFELGEFSKAIDALTRVIAANPRERNGRLMLAEAFLASGRVADAEEHFIAAAELIPANPRVWYGLGNTYEAMHRQDAAADAWKHLAALPPSVESHLHAAQMENAEHRWRAASDELRQALKLSPENATVRVALAWSLFRSRDYEAAMATLKGLLSTDNADVLFLYGASLLNLQQPAEAMPYLKAAITRNSRHLPARAALGQALLQLGKNEDAVGLLESALAADQDGSIHFQLFRAYQLTNRPAEAQQALAAYQRLRASLAGTP